MRDTDPSFNFEQIFRNLADETGVGPTALLDKMLEADQSLPTLELLNTTLHELWVWFSSFPQWDVGQRLGVREIAGYWKLQAFHQVRSALILDEMGLADSAVTNARAAMEYGIYLSLLALSQDPRADVVDQLAIKSLNRAKNSLTAIPQDDQPEVEHVTQILSQLIKQDETPDPINAHVLERVCKKIDNGEVIYFYYQFLSSLIHPGLGSALMLLPDHFHSASEIDLRLSCRRISLKMAIGGSAWASWAAHALIGPDDFDEQFGDVVHGMDFVPLKLKNIGS